MKSGTALRVNELNTPQIASTASEVAPFENIWRSIMPVRPSATPNATPVAAPVIRIPVSRGQNTGQAFPLRRSGSMSPVSRAR